MPRIERKGLERLRYDVSASSELPWDSGFNSRGHTRLTKISYIAYFLMRLFNTYSRLRSNYNRVINKYNSSNMAIDHIEKRVFARRKKLIKLNTKKPVRGASWFINGNYSSRVPLQHRFNLLRCSSLFNSRRYKNVSLRKLVVHNMNRGNSRIRKRKRLFKRIHLWFNSKRKSYIMPNMGFSCVYKNKVFKALKKEISLSSRTKLHAQSIKCNKKIFKVSLFSRWNRRLYLINTFLLNSIFTSTRHTCFLIRSYLKRSNKRLLVMYRNNIISRCLRTCISSSYVAL